MKKANVILLLVLCIIMLTSCDGNKSANDIKAKNYLDGNDSLKIDIKLKRAIPLPGGYSSAFLDDISIQQLEQYVANSGTDEYDLDTRTYQDKYILIRKTDKTTSKFNYYILFVYGLKEFYCPIATLDNNNTGFDIYMPYHLFNDEDIYVQTKPSNNYFNVKGTYRCIGDMSDFISFYNSIDRYNVEKQDDKLIIEDKQDKTKFYITFTYQEEGIYYKEKVTYVQYSLKNEDGGF